MQKEIHRSSKDTLRKMVLIAVLSAMVFALSWLKIQIGDISRLHLGNVMCLLSGVLFGPLTGGLSAGIGSMFYDFTDPLYISEFWITFITKFAMGYIAGLTFKIMPEKTPKIPRFLTAAIAGQATYIFLYFVKSVIMQHYVYGNPWPAVWPVVGGKIVISSINGIIAVVACVVLAPALHAAIQNAGIFTARRNHQQHG